MQKKSNESEPLGEKEESNRRFNLLMIVGIIFMTVILWFVIYISGDPKFGMQVAINFLVFIVLLFQLYIFSRQSNILEKQTKIFQRQTAIQSAQYEPFF